MIGINSREEQIIKQVLFEEHERVKQLAIKQIKIWQDEQKSHKTYYDNQKQIDETEAKIQALKEWHNLSEDDLK